MDEKENYNNNDLSMEGENSSGTSVFIKGAAILGVAALIVKIMGAFFRIPLGNMLGDTGMSYYQTAYPIYSFVLIASTAGIPTSVAKIISEKIAVGDDYGAERVFRVTLKFMALSGMAISTLLFLLAKPLTSAFNNEPAFWSVIAIAPSIFFVSLMSVYRGYFQGRQEMKAFANSQLVEQLLRVILGLGLAYILLAKGLEYSSAGATFGASVGSLAGLLSIAFYYKKFSRLENKRIVRKKEFPKEGRKLIIMNLIKLAVPITIGSSIIPVMNLFDLGVVMTRLVDIGYTKEVARSLYGQLTGYAQTIVNLPQVITLAIAISIVPAISKAFKLKDEKLMNKTVETGIRLALIIGLPCGVGLSMLSVEIMQLLYPMQLEISQNTGSILFILGYGIIFLSFFQVSTGIIQGVGKPMLPARNLGIGAIIKLILSYILVGMPALNIKGAPIATVTAFAISAILNFFTLKKYTNVKLDIVKVVLKPVISVIVMAIMIKLSVVVFGAVIAKKSLVTLISILVSGGIYGVMLLITDTLSDEDLEILPKGGKIAALKGRLRGKMASFTKKLRK